MNLNGIVQKIPGERNTPMNHVGEAQFTGEFTGQCGNGDPVLGNQTFSLIW